MLGTMAVTWGVNEIIKGLAYLADQLIVTKEEIREAAASSQSAIDSTRNSFSSMESTVTSVKDRYAELAQGIKQTGSSIQNINLSPDEYEEFLSLSNQLAETCPSLVAGYDSQGNAILNLKGDIDSIIGSFDAFIEKQREAANVEIAEQMPDLFKGTVLDSNDIKNQIKNLETKNQALQNFSSNMLDKKKTFGEFDFSEINQYKLALESLGLSYKELSYGIGDGTGSVVLEITSSEKEINDAINSFDDKILDVIGENKKQIASKQQELNQTWISMSDEMLAAISTQSNYKMLSDQAKEAFQSVFNGLDFASISAIDGNNTWEGMASWIDTNIIQQINGEAVQQAFTDMFTLQDDFEAGKVSVQKYLDTIAAQFADDGAFSGLDENVQNAIQKAFQYTSSDGIAITDMIANIKAHISDEMDGAIESLYLDDLEFAYQITSDGVMTFDELQKAIKQTRQMAEQGFDIHDRSNLESYLAASGNGNGGSYLTDYDSYTAMMQAAKELYDANRTGNETFKAAARAFSMNGMDDAASFAENYAQLSKYFSDDFSGFETFLKDLERIGSAEWDGESWVLNLENMQEAANQLCMPLEMFTVLLEGLHEYGFADDYFGSIEDAEAHLDELYAELAVEEAKLADMQAKLAAGDESVTDSALDVQIEKVNSLKDSIDTTIEGVDQLFKALSVEDLSTEYAQAEAVGQSLIEQWQNLQSKTEIDDNTKAWMEKKLQEQADILSSEYGIKINFDAEEVSHNLEEVQSQLQEFKDANNGVLDYENLDVAGAIEDYCQLRLAQIEASQPAITFVGASEATSETQTVISDLERIDELSKQISIIKELGLDTSEAETELQEITDRLNSDNAAEIMAKLHLQGSTSEEILDNLNAAGTIEIPASLQLVEQLDVQGQEVSLSVNLSNKEDLDNIKEITDSLSQDAHMSITVNAANLSVAEEAFATLSAFSNVAFTITLNGTEYAASSAEEITNLIDGIPGADPTINATDLATPKISTVSSQLDMLDGKTATTYVRAVNLGTSTPPYTPSVIQAYPAADGTAHASRAYVKGDWRLPHDENALVGELGAELLVRNGIAQLIGVNGAEFKGLKKNDIIFNHKQTTDLLRYGYITGRGKAIGFNSHAAGTASTYAGYTPTKTSSPVGSTAAIKANTKAVSKNTASVDDLKDTFGSYEDWIERYIDAFDTQYSQMERMANDLQDAYGQQNATINQMISSITKFQSQYKSMYDTYMQKAYDSGLDLAYQKKVIDGTINIESITDEAVKAQIDEFEKWYSAACDVQDKIQDLNAELKKLYNQKLENIEDDFDRVNDYYAAMVNHLENFIEMRKAVGRDKDGKIIDAYGSKWSGDFEKDYNTMLSNMLTSIDIMYQKHAEMQAEFNHLVNTGQIEKYSDDWYDWQIKLQEIWTSVDDTKQQYEEIQDEFREYHWEAFNENIAAIDYSIQEFEAVMDRLNSDNFLDEFGNITAEGSANIALIGAVLDNQKQKLADYTTAVHKLDQELANGVINQEEYTEYLREYLDEIRDASDAVSDYKDQLLDLYKSQLEIENSALKDNISLRQEALEKKKAYYDYDQKIRAKTKDLNALKAQEAAMLGVTSAAGRAELTRIQAQIAEAEAELNDTKQEHYFDTINDGYDALSDKADEVYDAVLDALARSARKQEEVVNEMLESIKTSYKDAYAEIARTIADAGILLSNETQSTVNSLGTSSGASNISDAAQTPNSNTSASSTAQNIKTNIDSTASENKNAVTDISLNKTSVSIDVGKTVDLTARVTPSGTTNQVSWSSNNTGVATVSGGTVTGKKAGTAKITATCGGKSASCSVTVKAPANSSGSGNSSSSLKTATNTVDGHNLRDAAGYSGKIIASMPKGSRVTLLGDKKKADGLTWYKVQYGNKTGWTSDYYLKFARGTKRVNKDQWAMINEQGPEMIVSPSMGTILLPYDGKSQEGTMKYLRSGDGVLNHDFTENLMEMGKLGANGFADKLKEGMGLYKVPNLAKNMESNSYQFGDYYVTINPTQKLDRQEMQTIGDYCYEYWFRQMRKDQLACGIKHR